ncbi:hypothetical protein ACIGKR_12270 [Rhodococcus qingshengii]|uniref:hypothetical protein n=2 Tax=Nocardiaceae TaxID=85025 RepID=UPI0037C59C1B
MIDELAKAIALEIGVDSWDYLTESEKADHRNAASVAICTIIPAGGMALTAEQVEDVRYDGWVGADMYMAMRKVGITEETAEAAMDYMKALGLVVRRKGVRITPADWPNPAPAEPAEEETKAEEFCCHPMCRHTNWGGINRKHERGADCPIVPKPASSPVVPAPTETEWQTWQEVPEGVKYSPKARPPAGSPLRLLAQPLWVNRGGTRYQARSGTVSKIGDVEMFHYAPFVAAEEVSMSDLPIGIGWKREGDKVVAHVIEAHPGGRRSELVKVTYTLEQAAENAKQLLAAMGGKS